MNKSKILRIGGFQYPLMIAFIMAIVSPSTLARDWKIEEGFESNSCKELLRTIKKEVRGNEKIPNACSFNIALNFSSFTEPNWKVLRIDEHKNILYAFIKYNEIGLKKENVHQEKLWREDVEKLVSNGARLLEIDAASFGSWRAGEDPSLFRVLQIEYPVNNESRKLLQDCPHVNPSRFSQGRVFIANKDLSSLSQKNEELGVTLSSSTIKMQSGQPVLIRGSNGTEVRITRIVDSFPMDVCFIRNLD